MAEREVTLKLTLTDPTIESVSELLTELRGKPTVRDAGILELEEKDVSFERDLERVINRHSRENGSNTPDFILAEYLRSCLNAFDKATKQRTLWYKSNEETPTLVGSDKPQHDPHPTS